MCGIFGIHGVYGAHHDAAAFTAVGLHALNHRGQEGAGIVSWDGYEFHEHHAVGLVGDSFFERVLATLPGHVAVGQVLYSTSEDSEEEKAQSAEVIQHRVQPFTSDFSFGSLAITHNGNLTNAKTLYRELRAKNRPFHTKGVDTEVALQLIGSAEGETLVERLQNALPRLEGAYSFVLLSEKKLIGVRDPLGIRPLFMGRVGEAFAFASEDCALHALNAEHICEVAPGEIAVIENGKYKSYKFAPRMSPKPCIFEYIYFARPDTTIAGKNMYLVRKELGRQLAREAPAKADMVIPIPDSAVPHALGYAKESGIEFELGIVRNHYVRGRSFIESMQHLREKRVIMKSSPNHEVVRGKSIILVDDSRVRGVTSARVVERLFKAGVREVHLRIASPPWRHGCYWGIDEKELYRRVASPMMSDEEVYTQARESMGVTTVAHLSLNGAYRAVYGEPRKSCSQACDHCFSGERPTPITDLVTLH